MWIERLSTGRTGASIQTLENMLCIPEGEMTPVYPKRKGWGKPPVIKKREPKKKHETPNPMLDAMLVTCFDDIYNELHKNDADVRRGRARASKRHGTRK